jgi:hypothetical protein
VGRRLAAGIRHATVGLGRRIGRRGSALIFFAFLDFVYAGSIASPPPSARNSPSLAFAATILPLWAWAVLWAVVGLICLVAAFRSRDRWAFAAAMALKTLWGTTFLLGWLFVGLERGYVSAVVWLVFAAWIFIISTWPESPGDLL